MSDQTPSSFKITDRRKFNADGTPRDAEPEPESGTESQASAEAAAAPAPASMPEPPQRSEPPRASEERAQPTQQPPPSAAAPQASPQQTAAQKEAEQAYNKTSAGRMAGMPQPSFLSLLNMLGVEAAVSLGMVQMPDHEAPQIDLEAARHMIDLLGVIQEKTRGNLTGEEQAVLEDLLANLRMQFVSLSRNK